MRVSLPVRGRRELLAALELLTRYAVKQLQRRAAAGSPVPPLYQSGVRYAREPPGKERWQTPYQTLLSGRGDCEDLAVWRAAELRRRGEDPRARVVVKRTGPRVLHALVRRGDGTLEDPSRALGM